MTPSAPAARLAGAVRVYNTGSEPIRALDGVDFTARSGIFTAVIGPSGSGKSTLLHCLAGLDRLTSGQAFIGETQLDGLDDRTLTRLRRRRVGVIFQAFNLLPGFDVQDNITLPSTIARHPVDPEWFREVIDRLGLGDRLRAWPSQLSGGEQQRVAAARALIGRPDLIVADEPTGNLDRHRAEDLVDVLRRAVAELSQTVVMVTHDAAMAAATDRVEAIVDGRIIGTLEAPTLDSVLKLGSRRQCEAGRRSRG
jgi:putative ABC transport system ATP-binding protein